MENEIIKWVLLGVTWWAAAFLVMRKMMPNRSLDFCNRLVSTVHAVLAVTLASISVETWSCPLCPLDSNSSPIQVKALALTLAYLIYDIICCLFYEKIDVSNTIHHLVSILGIGTSLIYDQSASLLVAALWVTEISSPFLHLRELLKELGLRDTDLNLAADISFAVIFTFGRIFCGPYILYVTLSAKAPAIIKVMAVGLQLVSAFWFYKIARMVAYKLGRRCTTKKVS